MNREQLEEIRARAVKATEGPWWFDESEQTWRLHGVAGRIPGDGVLPEQVINKQILKAPKTGTPYAEYWPGPADAEFIAHARTDVPALLAEIDQLKRERVVSVIFGHHKDAPRPFALFRRTDVTGVSGTGVVAEGAAFSDGTAVLRWLSEWPTSVVFHDRGVEAIEQIHGHGGATQIVWLSDELEPLAAMEQERDALRAQVEQLRARLAAATAEGIAEGDIEGSSEGSSTGGVS